MKLELFIGTTCPYCHMVQKEIEKEGRTDIEFCNIDTSDAHMKRLVEVGGKEQRSILQSARLLNGILPGSVLEIKEGLYHGEYSLNYPEQYVAELRDMIIVRT